MARRISFQLRERSYEMGMEKVDRDKLYGRKELVATGQQERPLRKGYLDEWGSVVISSTGMGYVDPDMLWHSKNELKAVNALGEPLDVIPSSFDAPIMLEQHASFQDYCEHEITSVYSLDGFDLDDLIEAIKSETGFFTFPFVYRAGYEAKTAFLLAVEERLFMPIGVHADLAFLSKPQRTDLDVEDEEDDDDLDFGMM